MSYIRSKPCINLACCNASHSKGFHMRNLNQKELAQVSGAANVITDLVNKIHAAEYKTIYKPLLQLFGLVKKDA